MATIKDVARAAGVSVATVSRALNGHPSVAPDNVARVHDAVAQLQYRPNVVARSLRRRTSDAIALVISDVENPFFTSITRGVEDVAQRAGLSVMLGNVDEDGEKESAYLDVVARQQVAGVILSPHSSDSRVQGLVDAGIPVVVVDRVATEETDAVLVDSHAGARDATEHLLAMGWEKPACITGPENAMTAEQRLAGYRDAMAAHGLPADRVRRVPHRIEGGRAAASSLLDDADAPDALFVANAQMALGALEEVRRRGLVIGRDLGMIAFDDSPWAPLITPAMSVVAQPAYEIGTRAAELLLARIRGTAPADPVRITLQTALLPRASTIRS